MKTIKSDANQYISSLCEQLCTQCQSDAAIVLLNTHSNMQFDVVGGHNIPHVTYPCQVTLNIEHLSSILDNYCYELDYVAANIGTHAAENLFGLPITCVSFATKRLTDMLGNTFGLIVTFLNNGQNQHDDIIRDKLNLFMPSFAHEIKSLDSSFEYNIHTEIISQCKHLIAFIDKSYCYRVVSNGFKDLFHIEPEEMVGQHIEKYHGQDAFKKVLKKKLDMAFKGKNVDFIYKSRKNDGSMFAIETSMTPYRDIRGKIHGAIVSASDISRLIEYQERLQEQASRDFLTGAYNRRHLINTVSDCLSRCKRISNLSGCIFLIDLNNFKDINDNYGHFVGDGVLREVVSRINDNTRKHDVLARLGGDEFVLMVELSTEHDKNEQIQQISDHLIACFSTPFQIETLSLDVSASIGCSLFDKRDASPDIILNRVDLLMYDAKKQSKSGVGTNRTKENAVISQHDNITP
ncbi:sensor domain-containing diguanylate cyclase [Parasalinivibrio latis]|uniref:sensor domain-containing diguanylate cyclase n=1 Tax=Parasalinivibrio latis TaxID=2952610 RepID=UPI0030E12F53